MRKGILLDNEGVSPVLGAILILAIGITILTNVQLNFVPVWNAQEELDHLKKMQDDFKGLKSNIESSTLSGTTLSSPLSMGFKYSPKMFVYNLRESAYASLDIQNNTWAEIRYNEIFPEGMSDDTTKKNITTSTITYTLHGAQTLNSNIYEHGLIRRVGSDYTASSQTILANNTINLLSIRPLESGITLGVEKRIVNIYPTSQEKNSVIGNNVWLILHTRPEYVDWWNASISKEGGWVKKIDRTNGIIITYINSTIIKMGEAYISTAPKTAPPHSQPYRLVKVTPQNTNLPVDGTTNLAVEVQDYYNNPVPNIKVSFSINKSRIPGNANATATLLQDSAVSGTDGRANVVLKTGGAGFYYIDASLSDPSYTITFAYPASSQGEFLSLTYTGSEPLYTITATLKDGLGNPLSGQNIVFDKNDGALSTTTGTTDAFGNASTILNTTNAQGIRITNIQSSITLNSSTITWDTINNITVTAKSGYVFNSIDIPADVNTTGCVQYSTSSGNYISTPVCDSTASSHSVDLTGLQSSTVYYFIVNSSRGAVNVNSSEYMFVTDAAPSDGLPPASLTNLTGVSDNPLFINWTWTDPTNPDFDHVEVYIDGTFKSNFSRGIQLYSAFYLNPNTPHTIATRTVDAFGKVNATWVNDTTTTMSAYTYVFDPPLSTIGTPVNFSYAQNAGDGLSAILSENMVGGVNNSDRPISPAKTTTNGTQSGAYNPANLNANGSIDITNLTQATTIKHASGNPSMALGTITGGSYSNTLTSNNAPYMTLRETTSGTLNAQWNNWEPFNESGNSSLLEMNIGIEAFISNLPDNEAVYIKLWDFSSNSWNSTWHQLGASGLPSSDTNAVFWYNITNAAEIQRFVNATGNYRIMFADAKNATGTIDGSRSTFSIDEFKVVFKYISDDTLDVTYTFNETNPSAAWKSISIQDWSYGDSLANISIYNSASGLWEPILTNPFTGVTIPAQHVNKVIGASGNASEYNASGQIKIRYNWTGATTNNALGVDEINVTVIYTTGGVYRLNITTNTTSIPNATNQELRIRYKASDDTFALQVWDGSSWNTKTTLSNTTLDYFNVSLSSSELRPDGITSGGSAGDINKYYVLVRYLDENPNAQQGKLYLDYQRVYSS